MKKVLAVVGVTWSVVVGCASAPPPTCPYPALPRDASATEAVLAPAPVDAGPDAAAPVEASAAIQQEAAAIVFAPAPPNLPAGVELAVLEGDPKREGMFTLRLKAPPGFLLPPHTHPVHERVTVISGSISVGFGETLQRDKARLFSAGSFYVNPPGLAHFVFSDAGAVVQITGMGPWRVDPTGKQP